MRRLFPFALMLLAACGAGGPSMQLDATQSRSEARQYFGAETRASGGPGEAIGFYSNGCVAGSQQLAETGPTWQAMRLSRNRNWGHPELIDYVQNLSAQVARNTSWAGLYVGDLSQPRGGPMLTGHASHQVGLDADIWMYPPERLNLSEQERETLSSISVRAERGASVNGNWTADHAEVLRLAATDPRVARIFVTTGVKVWLCENVTGDRSWLSHIRPANGHHYHFHVRLQCPSGDRNCQNQPLPQGDGCQEAYDRAERIRNPPPPSPPNNTPPPESPPSGMRVSLGNMPNQCLGLLSGFE
ncbi:penicillin-insensitive murein endopeptidase [Gymnodinialimonas ceratoperidinii]|uniref:Penicillin-insensitive murein endopeptidase n=1 Tax=Gymnodinialimonas ceratoperidinii TaxID=2856823 RepID=A0A8F6TYM7_9RHOB|nr:penicillin-insensitive murein endopeptidase [Gymnodinialimonas ceratoperidinii]QXT40126.1 penicillin-insensitive murein endopeptidase [Gymnodinialimonas ceratoperidinii]